MMYTNIYSKKGCMNMQQLFDATLLITKYDKNYEHCADLYDNLPYARNFDFCNGPLSNSYSGNIIKYYLYQVQEPTYNIALQPELVSKRIQEYQIQASASQAPVVEEDDASEMVTGITAEQMESLLSDPDAEQAEM